LALPRTLTAGLLLLDTLGLLAIDAEVLAGELDREAERDHIAHESFVNPGKSLALRLVARTPLLWGTDPVATAVAGHCAGALAAQAGVVAHAAGFHEAAALPVLFQQATRAGGEAALLHDPYEEQPGSGVSPVRPVLLGVQPVPGSEQERAAALETLPHADVVTADEELMVRPSDPGAAACAAAVLALRFDFAALYLGLSRGVLGGPGWVGTTGSMFG
ncbi:MAG: SIS domain-containing protein, partial [Pseudonocardiaceae bacterium]